MRTVLPLALFLTACDEEVVHETSPTISVDEETEETTPEQEPETEPDTEPDTEEDPEGEQGTPCEGVPVGAHEGDCAQDFTLMDAQGNPHSLWDYAGEIIVVDFSGFTCRTCAKVAPEAEVFFEENKDDLVMLTVLSKAETPEDINSWIDQYGSTHPVLWDSDNTVTGSFDAGSMPIFLLIDRDLTILSRGNAYEGFADVTGDAEELIASGQ